MFELIDKLNHIQYEELDIDEILDQRESHPFDTERMRVYNDVKELKRGKKFDDTTDIEKKAYTTVYKKSDNDELAGYICDDFELIADSKVLNYSDEWLDKLAACYEKGIIPCGEL